MAVPSGGPLPNTTKVHPELREVDAEHPRVVGIVRVQAEAASHRRDRGKRFQHQVATLNHDLGPKEHPQGQGLSAYLVCSPSSGWGPSSPDSCPAASSTDACHPGTPPPTRTTTV
jgi:hypothetical protein